MAADTLFDPIDEYFFQHSVSPEDMDALLATGWRHFGPIFFRYSNGIKVGTESTVVPLRLPLERLSLTDSQRRTLRKNEDLRISLSRPLLDDVRRVLFDAHKARFTHNVPDSLTDFLGSDPARVPGTILEMACHVGERLVAVSYIDAGATSVSGIYACFDPAEGHRRLGIATMIFEILWARSTGRQFYYPGYAYECPSHYDYKKQFLGLQGYKWWGEWVDLGL
jgi:leucyl-tRNA---protein transferase